MSMEKHRKTHVVTGPDGTYFGWVDVTHDMHFGFKAEAFAYKSPEESICFVSVFWLDQAKTYCFISTVEEPLLDTLYRWAGRQDRSFGNMEKRLKSLGFILSIPDHEKKE